MKKLLIRMMLLLLAFVFVFSVAVAESEDGMQFAVDGDIIVVAGYKYSQPFADEGAEGFQDGPADGSAKWTVPAGWVAGGTVDLPEGFNYSAVYIPEKYADTGMAITAMAGNLTSFVDAEALKRGEGNFDINAFNVHDLQNNIFAEASGIAADQLVILNYGSNEYLVYTLIQETPQGDYTFRLYLTTALAIHNGTMYQFVVFGTPENNDAYPDFVKLLESVTFPD